MTLGKMGDETKEEWHPSERDAVCIITPYFYPSSHEMKK